MTQLLEMAIREASKLSAREQDSLAAVLLDELSSEKRWSESFARSQDALARLAQEALAEHEAGKTQPL